ncbi:MAG: ComEC/Rec2 family competence protein [Clostridia bacterium]|nr:ComEC/Rec2 family competence protein [Clostridia bacterium]
MNIFNKRPLALVLCIGLGGFYLFSIGNEILRIILFGATILLGIISLILKIRKDRKILISASCIVLTFTYLLSFLYFDLYFNIQNKYKERIEITGIVEEIAPSSYSRRLLIRIEEINGEKDFGHKVYTYVPKNQDYYVLNGTRVTFTAVLNGFSDEAKQYNYSIGICAYADAPEDFTRHPENTNDISLFISQQRELLSRYIRLISNEETGALVSALLLGERDLLSDQLRLDFKRIGISHILALSGMHLAILSLGIGKFLSLLKVKKKARLVITMVFVFLYMAFTGFSFSVCRAGIMILVSHTLFLFQRTRDSLTALSVAVTVICLFQPFAIFSISLWLSAAATFGIIAYAELFSRPEKPTTIKEKIKSYGLGSIQTSIFAVSATLLISCVTFDSVSILSPISTLIFSFICELIMYLGFVMIIVGWFIPVGWLIVPLTTLVSQLAGLFSSIEITLVSTNFQLVWILIALYTLMFYLFIIVKTKNKEKAVKILFISFAFVLIVPTVLTVAENNKETVSYSGTSKCDLIFVRSDSESCLINSSTYSKNTAYDALDVLEESNVTVLDKYFLTHYSWSIKNDMDALMYNVRVKEIYIPAPRNSDEKAILKKVMRSALEHNAEVILLEDYQTIKVGEYSIKLLYSEPVGNTSRNALVIQKADTVYTYISSGILDSVQEDLVKDYLPISDYIILGEHGKKQKPELYIDECYEDLDCIVIHTLNIALTNEAKQFYFNNDCEIYLDPVGTVYFNK